MGIGDLADRHVESLSKGLKQRVALGRAIIHDPEVLILDEPAANLDPRARIEFRTLIRELAADGKTILLSSHILTELAEICDAVTVIEKGRILATGTVQDILEATAAAADAVACGWPAGGRRRALPARTARRREASTRPAAACSSSSTAATRSRCRCVGRLVAAGFPVLEFSAHSAGLEDLFIEITEGRRAVSRAAASLGWLEDTSDRLSPIVVKEVRQVVRGREFTSRSASACWSGWPSRSSARRRRSPGSRHVRPAGRSPR